MALSANLKTRLGKTNANIAWLVDFAFPDNAQQLALGQSYSSVTEGSYEGRILSISPLSQARSDRSGSVQAREVTITIADHDRRLAKIFEGPDGGKGILGSAVTIRLAEVGTAVADWGTRFVGVVTNVGFHEPFVATVRARTDDTALRRKVPKGRWIITNSDWPNAHTDILNSIYPILYGDLDSRQHGNTGAVECLPVDLLNFKYLVCAGRAKAVPRVYKDGVEQAAGGANPFSIVFTTVHGKGITLIDFSLTQGESVITADVQGYESTGDGTGALVGSGSTLGILNHFLTNFVFGDYTSGNWFSASTRVDQTAVTTVGTFLQDLGIQGAWTLLRRTDGYAVIRDLLNSVEIRAGFNDVGQITFYHDDPTFTDIYNASIPVLSQDAGFSLVSDDQAIVSSLVSQYAYVPAIGQYMKNLEAQDPSGNLEANEDLPQPFGTLV